jgi:DNA-binding transcriptional LysR family regulator
MIETSQLQTLVAVTRARSFSKAAEDLGVTQSAISQSIKNLESKLEIKIFKRSGKSIVLTPEGERLYHFGSHFLAEMRDTLDDLQSDKEQMRGKVRIGTLTGIGKSWLAHEIVLYAKENPDLVLSVRMGHQEDLLLDFENNMLDILILPEDELPTHGEREFFIEEKSTLVFPKDHSEFNFDSKLTLAKLEELPTVLFEKDDHLFFKWCRSKFKAVPKKMNIRFTVNSHGHMLQAVYEGLGISVVPNHVLNRSYFKDKVSTLGGEFEVPSGKLYIVYQKESENLLRVKNTIDRLLSHRDSFKI